MAQNAQTGCFVHPITMLMSRFLISALDVLKCNVRQSSIVRSLRNKHNWSICWVLDVNSPVRRQPKWARHMALHIMRELYIFWSITWWSFCRIVKVIGNFWTGDGCWRSIDRMANFTRSASDVGSSNPLSIWSERIAAKYTLTDEAFTPLTCNCATNNNKVFSVAGTAVRPWFSQNVQYCLCTES